MNKSQKIVLGILVFLNVLVICGLGVVVIRAVRQARTPSQNVLHPSGAVSSIPPTWTPTVVHPTLAWATSTPKPASSAVPQTAYDGPLPCWRTREPDSEYIFAGDCVETPRPTATPPGEEIADPNYLAGKAAYVDKDYAEVLRRMTLVLDADPDLAPAYWYRGMAYFYTENFVAGLVEMEAALALDPRYALGYADRGLMYDAMGDTDRAVADWKKALLLDPTLAKTHHNLGALYCRQGDITQSLEEYTKALTIDPGRAATWAGFAWALQHAGLTQNCVESADHAIELEPDVWLAYIARATCNSQLGRSEKALADFAVYLEAVPDDSDAWYNRGLCNQRAGHYQAALEDYTHALALKPTQTWALINRSDVYSRLNQTGLAYLDLAEARLYAADYGAAQDNLDKALPFVDPNSELMLRTQEIRGGIRYTSADYEGALEDLNAAIAGRPTTMAFYWRSLVYEALGEYQKAQQDMAMYEQLYAGAFSTAAVLEPPSLPDLPLTASLGDAWVRPMDGASMRYVPGGEFQMGSDDEEVTYATELCDTYGGDCSRSVFEEEEQPAHTVALDSFWIDRLPVTVKQFRLCMDAFACQRQSMGYATPSDAYPMIFVSWEEAETYCEWAGGRLPTEAEWEYAARGPEGHVFPWGDTFDAARLNDCDASCQETVVDTSFDDGYPDLAPTGSFPEGASWCGAEDMAGGVWEWVADWFGPYSVGRQVNPTGPTSGISRVARGGTWSVLPYYTRSATRGYSTPDSALNTMGFRCALSANSGEP